SCTSHCVSIRCPLTGFCHTSWPFTRICAWSNCASSTASQRRYCRWTFDTPERLNVGERSSPEPFGSYLPSKPLVERSVPQTCAGENAAFGSVDSFEPAGFARSHWSPFWPPRLTCVQPWSVGPSNVKLCRIVTTPT